MGRSKDVLVTLEQDADLPYREPGKDGTALWRNLSAVYISVANRKRDMVEVLMLWARMGLLVVTRKGRESLEG